MKMNLWKFVGYIFYLIATLCLSLGVTLILMPMKSVSVWGGWVLTGAGIIFFVIGAGLIKKKLWALVLATMYEIWIVPAALKTISLRLERDYFIDTLKNPNQIMDLLMLALAVLTGILWRQYFKSRKQNQNGMSSV